MAAAPPATGSEDAAALPSGHRLSDYKIDRMLGGGGFGITYLATDSNLDLTVAIKEYFPGDLVIRDPRLGVKVRNSEDEGQYLWGLERFIEEARALASFRHRNIVRVMRYFRDNNTGYIVMEYESGEPLKRWVPRQTPLSLGRVMSIVNPVLDGLEAVHKAGFLHRDIKPDNIYVRHDGTPVLLDFGSARRTTSQRDLTNIVSPGFAPFEQYHAGGRQGPWTDLYSLGAVLYWMTTGIKPVDAASRVKEDPMVPAMKSADPAVFGETLLRAIDWCLSPDEMHRPPSVSALRDALPAPGSDSVTVDVDLTQWPPGGGAPPGLGVTGSPPVPSGFAHSQSTSQMVGSGVPSRLTTGVPSGVSQSASRLEGQPRTLLCTILFTDIAGFSTRSVNDQQAIKERFTQIMTRALFGVAENTRIIVDTGDGAAICFLGDPEEALSCAQLLRDLFMQRYGDRLSVRAGLHMGPVRIINDVNQRVNLVGDGMNTAQRVMDFASPGQLLVSRAFFDVVSRISDDSALLFEHLGLFQDKHARSHELYSVRQAQAAAQAREDFTQRALATTQAMVAPAAPLAREQVEPVENELARLIGPLARVLVKKAAPRAASVAALREALAPSIPEPHAREAFLHGAPSHGNSRSGGTGSSGGSAASASGLSARSSPPSQSAPGLSRPISRPPHSLPSQPSTPSGGSRPSGASAPGGAHSGFAPSQPAVRASEAQLAALERALSQFIGPMAKVLVKREAARQPGVQALVDALAAGIDRKDERERFVAAARQALR